MDSTDYRFLGETVQTLYHLACHSSLLTFHPIEPLYHVYINDFIYYIDSVFRFIQSMTLSIMEYLCSRFKSIVLDADVKRFGAVEAENRSSRVRSQHIDILTVFYNIITIFLQNFYDRSYGL
jgi:hypothetical protein